MLKSEKKRRAIKFFLIGFLCLAALLSGRHSYLEASTGGAENEEEIKKEADDENPLLGLQQNIRDEYAKENPDLSRIANIYQYIFSLDPHTQQGKMALWEAYFTRKKQGDLAQALVTLQLFFGYYRPHETMIHPLATEHPVNLHATADVEQAMIYSTLSNSKLVGAGQLSQIPLKYKNAWVGIIDGNQTYYGRVEVIVDLKIADAFTEAAQYDKVINLYRDIVQNYSDSTYATQDGVRDIEWIVMKRMEDAFDSSPLDLTKKASEIDAMAKICKRRPAKAEAEFIKASFYEKRIEQFHDNQDVTQAEQIFRSVALDYHDIRYPTSRGEEAMGPRAIVRGIHLLTKLSTNYPRVLRWLMDIENSVDRSTKEGQETAAYARIHQAAILLLNLGNPQRALFILEGFAKEFPQALVYPHDAQKPKMLFEVAAKLTEKAKAFHQNSVGDSQ